MTPDELVEQEAAGSSAVVVDRNRWFMVSLVLLVTLCFMGFYMMSLASQAANNMQVVYVKMQPDGTWDVDYYDDVRPVEFFKKTVDSMLSQYVQYRYREMPKSVQADWGSVQFFMGTEVYNYFVDKNGFNAPKRAVEIEECQNCQPVNVVAGDVVHIDFDTVEFDGLESKIYRTQVHFKEIRLSREGVVVDTQNKMAILHWRVMSRKEVEAIARKDPNILKINPIGLQITKEDIIKT